MFVIAVYCFLHIVSAICHVTYLVAIVTTMDRVIFTINGVKFCAGCDVTLSTSLNDYIRHYAELRGTKVMCQEGGCGACIVTVRAQHPVTKEEQVFSVNSCLVSVLSCHGWAVTTIEGLGNRTSGYNDIQARLADFNGSQCGYCSPGWVMAMYSLSARNPQLTAKEVEQSFGSNICRCTGYRPILDALKSFAVDANPKLVKKLQDIEDLCVKTKKLCSKICTKLDSGEDWCMLDVDQCLGEDKIIQINLVDLNVQKRWYKVYTVKDVFKVLDKEGYDSYIFVAGNTSHGVFPIKDYPRVSIDISGIEELKRHTIDVNVVLGAGITLTDTITLFKELSANHDDFNYLEQFVTHLNLVAHIPVRNIGTIAGNLCMKHQHHEFPSDVFLTLATVGATITLLDRSGKRSEVDLTTFLSIDLSGKLMLNVKLPPLSTANTVLRFYKIMPRAQNAHAQVNAGFLFYMDSANTNTISKASIVYGGITPKFIHASATEELLLKKDVFTNKVLQLALNSLSNEIVPNVSPPDPSSEFRKQIALSLFYRAILSSSPSDRVVSKMKSGSYSIARPVSKGTQLYETEKGLWPLNQPIPKIEAQVQCSGEATYCDDLPAIPGELFVCFVLATVGTGIVEHIDISAAMAIEGVKAVYTAEDIPGKNSFIAAGLPFSPVDQEILCSGKILYHSQPLAIVVANSENLANRASELVKVSYSNTSKKPVLTIRDAIKAPKEDDRITPLPNSSFTPTDKGKDVKKVVKGSIHTFGQYHYALERQTCIVIPVADGVDVYSATQWPELTQITIAEAINIPVNRVNMTTRPLGGGFGSKLSRAGLAACAAAVAASHTRAPCRALMPLRTAMSTIGKRMPSACDYEVGVDGKGKIQYLEIKFYMDFGCQMSEEVSFLAMTALKNFYEFKRWKISSFAVRTDNPQNTVCGAPGNCEGIAMIEHIMEHIAFEVQKDIGEIRTVNKHPDNPLPSLVEYIKKDCDYDARKQSISTFNKDNRWKKRSIKILPSMFKLLYFGCFTAVVTVYHRDGTVAVSHGGVEVGQGVNTKLAQVCAHFLGIPLEMISVKPTNSLNSGNNIFSAASFTSECCCYAAMKACIILQDRLRPLKDKMTNPTWKEIIAQAYANNIDLLASYMFTPDSVNSYDIYGVAVMEIEVDILTGNHQILRVDILEDTGQSMNPELDVGQVEGAFIMGLGYWTSEKLVYDDTGNLLTDRTWTYKTPGANDIPVDMRIQFRRNSINPSGILGAKAVGEPPLCLAVVVTHAIREALMEARADAGFNSKWLHIDFPFTNENILLAAQNRISDFTLS